ncbi:MAG TPA: DUF3892 domain-containing protein [Candidatus Saccharimonadales bacterium]|nr:DUF3892 domain-containing protein [Candidatus Saccharimonadales bacterium]
MAVRIVAVRKSGGYHQNPHEAISHYKWLDEASGESKIADRASMVKWVEDGGNAYVKSAEGTVNCYVNQSSVGTKFLETRADSRSSNNLLNLPES